MIKLITALFLCCVVNGSYAQDFSDLWQGYFSYNDIKDVVKGNNKIYAASENAVFTYDLSTAQLETITTLHGLSGQTITTIAYNDTYGTLLIGYANGLIEVVSGPEHNILSVVDILDKQTIPPTLKRINHFNMSDGLVYISTDYGISVYDLERLEFGDTFFIGNGGNQINVNQTTILNNTLYAACGNNNAIKSADVSNPNLIDYQQWKTLGNGNFVSVAQVDNRLYAVKTDQVIYEIRNDAFTALFNYSGIPLDTKSVDNKLVVTTPDRIYVYNSSFNLLTTATLTAENNTQFTSAIITENMIFTGTKHLGVLKSSFLNATSFEEIKPEGPLMNDAFKIEAAHNTLWVTYGDYTESYNPFPLRSYGMSQMIDDTWKNTPFDDLLTAQNLNYIAVNPFNPSQVFISACQQGILELNGEVPKILLDHTNSGLESLRVPSSPSTVSVRQTGSLFDRNGVLWTLTCRVDKALKSFNPSTGEWRGYSFKDIIPDAFNDELGFGDITIDRNGTKWIGAFRKGVIGYNENGSKIKNLNTVAQNMPSTVVNAVAVDNNGQLWIGTIKGLRVLYNTAGFFEDSNANVKEIVVLDDGIPQELLSNQYITDIKVDGSNNKWIGTLDAGVFYFSADGQQTIYHFTTDNSPLPSNFIKDISIDAQNGKIYIATAKGLLSFTSGGSTPKEELTNAFVYPNPVRPEYNILGASSLNDINKGVKIKGITENVNIKITDIEGNLVAEAQSRVNLRASSSSYNFAIDGGTAIWNGKNLANNIVASGVYLIMISDLYSFETKVLKLLIIR
ncbi:type IX secretion system anionic LPS delivery protein PorZ [Gelidibacter salicanalis]|uniref:ABC transporter substrate-binding protein n=1 Tax=Gelidibacter salicanalis TaxID=291193 RepID=A0A934KMQ6_9FLAO|nr:two-component regulator propeller domain-containing protein [Gelidibacter salicanalis]MBJ7882067.1 ABC transporter substrate-binding protein [Gelidibacter salicanalis]